MKARFKILIAIALVIFLLAGAFLARGFWEVQHPVTEHVEISCNNLPRGFDGFRILQISDLHGRFLSDDAFWAPLLSEKPDIIVLTGDVLSRESTDEQVGQVAELVEKLAAVSPVYYVGGNHEAQTTLWEKVAEAVTRGGGMKLSDLAVKLERGGDVITLLGLRDPARRTHPYYTHISYDEQTKLALEELSGVCEDFTLLLAHRPDQAEEYAAAGADVALCGHTHGGQIRLPFIGALFAPSQGMFPEYSAGLYQVDEMQMYVSRGLGGELRFLCRPEVTLHTLKCA